MGPLSSQTLWLWTSWTFGAFSARPIVSLLVTATSTVVAATSLSTTVAATSVVTASSTVAVTTTASVAPTSALVITTATAAASTFAVAAPTASIAVTVSTTASAAALFDELGGDSAFVLSRSENVERLGASRLCLRWHHRSDEHAIDGEFSIHTYDVADSGTLVEQ